MYTERASVASPRILKCDLRAEGLDKVMEDVENVFREQDVRKVRAYIQHCWDTVSKVPSHASVSINANTCLVQRKSTEYEYHVVIRAIQSETGTVYTWTFSHYKSYIRKGTELDLAQLKFVES